MQICACCEAAGEQLGANAAMEVELSNDSPLGGREIDRLTTVLHNGVVYYFLGVAPESEMNRYTAVFDRMISSIRLQLTSLPTPSECSKIFLPRQ
jgi:hypothetical protein